MAEDERVELGDSVTTDIRGCARCHGEGHTGLAFEPLVHPIEIDGYPPITHWCACPLNGQPILMHMQKKVGP